MSDTRTVVGLLHPGAMGTMVGAALREGGAEVVWASERRGAETARRAQEAGLVDVGTVGAVVARSAVIVSVVPPHAALDVACAVAGHGFGGLYVDGNAVSPATALEIGRVMEKAGASYVDGGIIGPAGRQRGVTRLYLAGAEAPRAARLFEGTLVEPVVLGGPVPAASALKMAYAAFTKGVAALVVGIRAVAAQHGVGEALLAEWSRSQPDLVQRSERMARAAAPKAWRWVAEMEEIARTFVDAGLPGGFHEAAAEIFRRMSVYKDVAPAPGAEAIADTVRGAVSR